MSSKKRSWDPQVFSKKVAKTDVLVYDSDDEFIFTDNRKEFLRKINIGDIITNVDIFNCFTYYKQLHFLLENKVDLGTIIKAIKIPRCFPYGKKVEPKQNEIPAYQFIDCLHEANTLEELLINMCKKDYVTLYHQLNKNYNISISVNNFDYVYNYDSYKIYSALGIKPHVTNIRKLINANSIIILTKMLNESYVPSIKDIEFAIRCKANKSLICLLVETNISVVSLVRYFISQNKTRYIQLLPKSYLTNDKIHHAITVFAKEKNNEITQLLSRLLL
jgi:hypothetical protein